MKLKKQDQNIRRDWHLVDINGKILGRTATEIAQLLMGKGKPNFVPYWDVGDYVVVINAVKVKVTGRKTTQKVYMRYSGYPGGLKRKTFAQVQEEDPTRIVKEAVTGMLPKNKLQKLWLKRLYVFIDDKHPYENKFKVHLHPKDIRPS